MLNTFTLVIPTYNRYPFLLRLLKFYESYCFPFRIIVLDSSSDLLDSRELKSLLAHERIIHQRFDSDIFIGEKIARGVQDITTPYAALCGDDDFIIPTAVMGCIQFLEQNPDYSCAQGFFILHHSAADLKRGEFRWGPLYYDTGSNKYALAHERVHAYLALHNKAGGHQFYAVHRSDILRMIWKETAKYVSDLGLVELFSGSLSVIYGKRKVLPIFYSSREINDFVVLDKDYLRTCYSLEKCEKAIRGIAIHLQKAEGLRFETAELMARKNLNAYVDRVVCSDKSHSSSSFVPIIISKAFGLKNSVIWKLYHIKYSWIIEQKSSRFYSDYLKVKDAVFSAGLGPEELNHARKGYRRD